MSNENVSGKEEPVDARILVQLENIENETPPKKRSYFKIVGGGILVIFVLFFFPILGNWVFEQTQKSDSNPGNELEVKTVIRNLKQQLIEASEEAERKGEESFLVLDTVDLEINYVVRTGNNTIGGAKFYVISADNSSKSEFENSQKIRLHLKVKDSYSGELPNPPKERDSDDFVPERLDTPPPPKTKR